MKTRRSTDTTKLSHPDAKAAVAAFQDATLRLFNVFYEDRLQNPDTEPGATDAAPGYAMVDVFGQVIEMMCALAANMPLDPNRESDRAFMRNFLTTNIKMATEHGVEAAIERWRADSAS